MNMLIKKKINDRIPDFNIETSDNSIITKVISLFDILYNPEGCEVKEDLDLHLTYIYLFECEVKDKIPSNLKEDDNIIDKFNLYRLLLSFLYNFTKDELIIVDKVKDYNVENVTVDGIGYYIDDREEEEYIFISRIYEKGLLSLLISYESKHSKYQIKNILHFDKELKLKYIEYKKQIV